jgi:transcriptional regulator with XRE-family HTH domain
MPMLRRGDSYCELVDELRRWRQSRRIEIHELSERIGVADALASRWECDDKRPSLFLAVCWAQAIGARLAILPARPRHRPARQPQQLTLPF